MFTDFLGACLNLTQLAGSNSTYRLEFVTSMEEALDLSGATFGGKVTACSDGTTYPLGVAASEAATNILGLSFPELALGNYHYEMTATDDSGDSRRIVYGQLLVLNTSLDLSNDEGSVYRTLQVREPAGEARSLQLRWLSSSLAQLSAEEAQQALKDLENEADGIKEEIRSEAEAAKEEVQKAADEATEDMQQMVSEAKEELQQALDETIEEVEKKKEEMEQAADETIAELERVAGEMEQKIDEAEKVFEEKIDEAEGLIDDANDTLANAKDFMDAYPDMIRSQIYINSSTNTWWIGGVDTFCQATGDSGKSPYIGEDGYWLYYDDSTEQWLTGVQAQGDDGHSPYISATGNWTAWNDDENAWYDTGVRAQGVDGLDGDLVRRVADFCWPCELPEDGENGLYYYVPSNRYCDTTGEKTTQGTCRWFTLSATAFPHRAALAELVIHHPEGLNVDDDYAIYMGVWKEVEDVLTTTTEVTTTTTDADGNSNASTETSEETVTSYRWVKMGVSANTQVQEAGKASVWTFDDGLTVEKDLWPAPDPLDAPEDTEASETTENDDGGTVAVTTKVTHKETASYTGRVLFGPLKESEKDNDQPSTENRICVGFVTTEATDGSTVAVFQNLNATTSEDISLLNSWSLVEETKLVSAELHQLDPAVWDGTYMKFGWIENADGTFSYQAVCDSNLARSDLYGLVKLGTDVTISDGAVVGNNGDGQMTVPVMDAATNGTAKLSDNSVMTDDKTGAIGLNASGQLRALNCTFSTFGAARPSLNTTVDDTTCICLDSQGRLSAPWASPTQAGVVKLGSRFGQTNPIPYQQGVGATSDHQLTNNIVYKGALKHMEPQDWVNTQMTWLDEVMEAHPEYFEDMYYIGLHTSNQFTQSQGSGLVLQTATTTRLAGVYMATDIDDNRDNAVLNAAQVKEQVTNLNDRITEEVDKLYSKIASLQVTLETRITNEVATLNSRINSEVSDLNTRIAEEVSTLNSKIKSEVATLNDKITALTEKMNAGNDERYTKDDVDKLLETLNDTLTDTLKAWVIAQGYDTENAVNSKLQGYVRTTETVTEIQALTTEEFNSLDKRDDTTLYLN